MSVQIIINDINVGEILQGPVEVIKVSRGYGRNHKRNARIIKYCEFYILQIYSTMKRDGEDVFDELLSFPLNYLTEIKYDTNYNDITLKCNACITKKRALEDRYNKHEVTLEAPNGDAQRFFKYIHVKKIQPPKVTEYNNNNRNNITNIEGGKKHTTKKHPTKKRCKVISKSTHKRCKNVSTHTKCHIHRK